MKMEVVSTTAVEGGDGEDKSGVVQREKEEIRVFLFFLIK